MNTEKVLIKNATVVSDGVSYTADVLINGERIEKIERNGISAHSGRVIDATGKWLIPGVIDDQVHFREPGLTHKADIGTESLAALAGGTTSYMEMPNVNPQTTTITKLEEKFLIGKAKSHVNYSFFLGATNHNLDELKKINAETTCGVKIFMGSSTGDMLVDDEHILAQIFANVPALIATHCESEERVKQRTAAAIEKYGEDIPPFEHPIIRDAEACWLSSSDAAKLAIKYNTRLHILHITTARELDLFSNLIPLKQKRITSEVCIHHLHFTSDDYAKLGNLIKCNPAIKEAYNRDALWNALLDNRLDIIATDHAPHTWDEKSNVYTKSPAGLPLVQHSTQLMLNYVKEGKLTIEKMVEKMCHAPAECFRIIDRGFIREGYYADLVLIDPTGKTTISKDNILYKCAWSPLEGVELNSKIEKVFVNGTLSWDNGFTGELNPKRLDFYPFA